MNVYFCREICLHNFVPKHTSDMYEQWFNDPVFNSNCTSRPAKLLSSAHVEMMYNDHKSKSKRKNILRS